MAYDKEIFNDSSGRPPVYKDPINPHAQIDAFQPADTLCSWELNPELFIPETLVFDDFPYEENLCDFIEDNIANFCIDILEEEYVTHTREWNINKRMRFGPRPKTVDFLVETDSSEHVLVECKNPSNCYCELRSAIAQLMSYEITCKENKITPDRIVLVTSAYHPVVGKMIDEYSLPFEVIILSKSKALKYKELVK